MRIAVPQNPIGRKRGTTHNAIIVMKPAPIPQDYTTFLAHLKQRVVAARVHAAQAVNYDLVLLYWDIGQGIVEKQKNADWGDAWWSAWRRICSVRSRR